MPAPRILPVALISPEVITLPATTFPVELSIPVVTVLATLSNVNPDVALATPPSLNITSVLAPGEETLPEMLPIK